MDTNIGVNHERHEIHEKTQNHEWTRMDTNIEVNHEWTRMDTNIEVNHEIHEIHENSEPRIDTNSRSSVFF